MKRIQGCDLSRLLSIRLLISITDYAALLSQDASLIQDKSVTGGMASTGRLYFRKKTLTYSFIVSPAFGKAQLLAFLDVDGNIIEEFPLPVTHFQQETGKICGTWQRLPRRYRRQLRRDELYAQLTNENGQMISGKVGKHYGLRSELFSALAVPEIGTTSGETTSTSGGTASGAATAVVSLDSLTGSVHVNLLMSGIFETNGEKNVPLEVKFSAATSNGETRQIIEAITIPKIDQSLTSVDFTTVIDESELAALGKGRLSISVHAKNAPHNLIKGFVVPRFSCDLFDTILSHLDEEDYDEEEDQELDPNAGLLKDARGLAWMQMDRSGLIKYHLKWNDLPDDLVSIQIDNGRKSQRLLRIVHEMDFQVGFKILFNDTYTDSQKHEPILLHMYVMY